MGKKQNVADVASGSTKKSKLRQNLEVLAFLLCPGTLIKFSIDTIREQPNMPKQDKILYYGGIMSIIELYKIGIELYVGYQLARYISPHIH